MSNLAGFSGFGAEADAESDPVTQFVWVSCSVCANGIQIRIFEDCNTQHIKNIHPQPKIWTFLQAQKDCTRIHAFFYKNNFIRTMRLKFAPKINSNLRTIEARQVFIEKRDTMLQDSYEKFLRKTVF